jgi:CO/xanthine dehydrogenase FAD-binding subunit
MTALEFKSPGTLQEACRLLAKPGSRPIAGGTDVIPQMRDGRFQAAALVDLSRVGGLDAVEHTNGDITIGSLTTYTTMLNSPLLQAHAPFLSQVSGIVGGVQTQNRGTLGGNIANASPAGDTLPVLLALDAIVDLVSDAGERSLPLAGFLLGPGQTALRPGEIVRQVRFAPLPPEARSLFLRLGNRRGMLISVVSAALVLRVDDSELVHDCRIALGAVAPTAIRCREAETILLGRRVDAGLIDEAAAAAAAACRPIDDVRASAAYRRHGVRVMVRRGLRQLAGLEEATR